MKFSEVFLGRQNKLTNTKKLNDLGAYAFNVGKTDKNQVRTPHYEIDKCMKMYEEIPLVQTGIDQMMLWLYPDDYVEIVADNQNTKKQLQEWHEQRKGILQQYKNILQTNLICGNAPVEFYRVNKQGKEIGSEKEGVIDNVFSFNDMSRIYINPNPSDDGSDAYVFQVAEGTTSFMYRGKVRRPDYYYITYIKNYNYIRTSIYGIPISDKEMQIFKSGWSRDGLYGRASLASAIDAANIYHEIISSWDTIARTRQIDQKIISLADNVDNSIQLSQERMKELEDMLEDSEKSYILLDAPMKLVNQDIQTSGNYDLMTGVFDLVRKMLMMSLLPQHLTPWNESATTQGSESAMPPFLSRLKSKQNEFINWHKENILNPLMKEMNLKGDAWLSIQDPKVMDTSNTVRTVSDLIRDGVINKQQAVKMLIASGVLDEEVVKSNNNNNKNNKGEK